MFSRFMALFFLIFALIPRYYAYSLSDHAQITRVAATTLSQCFPHHFPADAIDPIIEANQWEDQFVLRKWFEYSHFYNPEREFSSHRLTSHDRILDLEARLSALHSTFASEELIGKALHHLQDMTAPPHVIPVNHFWTDGFEKLDVSVEPRFSFSSCASLVEEASRTSLSNLHQMLAEETWTRVRTQSLRATRLSNAGFRNTALPLIAFWSPGGGTEWGSYGIFGNSFGEQTLNAELGTFRISPREYDSFKQQQLQSALRASQLILTKYYVLGI